MPCLSIQMVQFLQNSGLVILATSVQCALPPPAMAAWQRAPCQEHHIILCVLLSGAAKVFFALVGLVALGLIFPINMFRLLSPPFIPLQNSSQSCFDHRTHHKHLLPFLSISGAAFSPIEDFVQKFSFCPLNQSLIFFLASHPCPGEYMLILL